LSCDFIIIDIRMTMIRMMLTRWIDFCRIVPEAVSFSFVAGVEPAVGLQSAWIMGIITSLCGGRPGMVAGSTGA
jgi:hypothetical protein